MSEISPGQASWIARNGALAGAQDDADMLLTWPFLDPEQRQAEEDGAQAALKAATCPHGDLAAERDELRKLLDEVLTWIENPAIMRPAPEPEADMSEMTPQVDKLTIDAATGPCPGCESLRRQCSELAGELGAAIAGNRGYRVLLAETAAGEAAITAERVELRELLDEIGIIAANAPEDGDSFGLLEQIAMRIAAAGVPDSTPLDEWPDPGNPVTGRTPGAVAEELRASLDGLTDRALAGSIITEDEAAEYRKVIGPGETLREQLTGLRERFGNLAAGLMLSAGSSAPSKKSEIEHGCARAIRGILEG
jgi:hypothetical protein